VSSVEVQLKKKKDRARFSNLHAHIASAYLLVNEIKQTIILFLVRKLQLFLKNMKLTLKINLSFSFFFLFPLLLIYFLFLCTHLC